MEGKFSIIGLSVKYESDKDFILKNVGFDVAGGEIVSIIGESGCGKTTLAKAVIGVLPADAIKSGKISVEDVDSISQKESDLSKGRSEKIGIVFQDSLASLNPTLKIWSQIKHVHKEKCKHVNHKHIYEEACSILKLVGLLDCDRIFQSYPAELSGGTNQKINIALSLIREPNLLILDEPTSSLDISSQEEMLKIIQHIRKHKSTAIIFITHDIILATKISDRIIVMKGGHCIESCSRNYLGTFDFKKGYTASLYKDALFCQKRGNLDIQSGKCLLEFVNVSKAFFEKKVIDDMSFSILKGESFGLVGKIGSGKSTICKLICGIYMPDSGTIKIQDKTRIEMVFQNANSSLNPYKMVRDSLNENCVIRKDKKYSDSFLLKYIEPFGLPGDILDRIPSQLSGGQKQKIAIIRALLNRPDLIIFDEPTSSLDVTSQRNILNIVKDMQKKYPLTYVFISHNQNVIEHMCNRYMAVDRLQ